MIIYFEDEGAVKIILEKESRELLRNTHIIIFNEKQTLFILSFRQSNNCHHQEITKRKHVQVLYLLVGRCHRVKR